MPLRRRLPVEHPDTVAQHSLTAPEARELAQDIARALTTLWSAAG